MTVGRTEAQHEHAQGIHAPAAGRSCSPGCSKASAPPPRPSPRRSRRSPPPPRRSPRRFAAGRRVGYAGAGSSGLMALADALELAGTFGIPRDAYAILFAGGVATLLDHSRRPRGRRPTQAAARRPQRRPRHRRRPDRRLGQRHHALRGRRAEAASAAGATIVGIANIEARRLLGARRRRRSCSTPPEVIAGSTRMGAGTAQKIALNMLSTLAGIHLGHVHDGYMVNLVADNIKLRGRAARIVAAHRRRRRGRSRAPRSRRPAARSSRRSCSPPAPRDRGRRRAAARRSGGQIGPALESLRARPVNRGEHAPSTGRNVK